MSVVRQKGNEDRDKTDPKMLNGSAHGDHQRLFQQHRSKADLTPSSGHVRFSNRPSGSSAFRLSTTPVSMSLTGSRFSSESAPRPFHHGIRGSGGTIFAAALP